MRVTSLADFLRLRPGGPSARGPHGCDSESHGEGLSPRLVRAVGSERSPPGG